MAGIAAYSFITKALSVRETENARLHINSLRLIWKTEALLLLPQQQVPNRARMPGATASRPDASCVECPRKVPQCRQPRCLYVPHDRQHVGGELVGASAVSGMSLHRCRGRAWISQ